MCTSQWKYAVVDDGDSIPWPWKTRWGVNGLIVILGVVCGPGGGIRDCALPIR